MRGAARGVPGGMESSTAWRAIVSRHGVMRRDGDVCGRNRPNNTRPHTCCSVSTASCARRVHMDQAEARRAGWRRGKGRIRWIVSIEQHFLACMVVQKSCCAERMLRESIQTYQTTRYYNKSREMSNRTCPRRRRHRCQRRIWCIFHSFDRYISALLTVCAATGITNDSISHHCTGKRDKKQRSM